MKFFKKFIFILPFLFLLFTTRTNATKEMKIVFVGNCKSGKTALRAKLCGRPFDFESRGKTTNTTDSFLHNLRYGDEDIMCELFDTSGNQKVKNSIIVDRLRGASVAVIAIDLSRNAAQGYTDLIEQTLDEWIKAIRKVQPNTYIILAATKSDNRAQNVNLNDLQTRLVHIKGWFAPNIDWVITSALEGTGIGDLWNKVRNALANEGLYNLLLEYNQTRKYMKDTDDATKKCVIL